MKKIILATTAFGVLSASAALAAGPTVTLGGFLDFQGGYQDQESGKDISNGGYGVSKNGKQLRTESVNTQTNTALRVKVDGKSDAGLGYGGVIELFADPNKNDRAGTNSDQAKRAFLYVENQFGKVEAGAAGDAARALQVDASSIARATGGIAGDFTDYVDLTGPKGGQKYLTAPYLPTNATPGEITGRYSNDRATANKISYYTPKFQGVQAGVSFTPNQNVRGTSNSFGYDPSSKVDEDVRNNVDAGINYSNDFNGLGVKASLTGQLGKAESRSAATRNQDDIKAYALGASLSHSGASVAASYGKLDELGQAKSAKVDGRFYSLGAAYEIGAFAVSTTFLDSKLDNGIALNKDADFQSLSFGTDYQLAPGLVPYVEVTFFDTDDNDKTTKDNKGSVVIAGTTLNF